MARLIAIGFAPATLTRLFVGDRPTPCAGIRNPRRDAYASFSFGTG